MGVICLRGVCRGNLSERGVDVWAICLRGECGGNLSERGVYVWGRLSERGVWGSHLSWSVGGKSV